MVLLDLPNLVFFAPLLPLLLLATSKTLAMNGSKKLVLGSPVTKHLIQGRTIYIKRDDLLDIHGLSGNKARKYLKLLLETSETSNNHHTHKNLDHCHHLVSYGGIQSNSMLALSQIARNNQHYKFTYFVKRIPKFLSNPVGNYQRALQNGMEAIELESTRYEDMASGKDVEMIMRENSIDASTVNFIEQGGVSQGAEFGLQTLAQEIVEYISHIHSSSSQSQCSDHKVGWVIFIASGTGTSAFYLNKAIQTLQKCADVDRKKTNHFPIKVIAIPCVGTREDLMKRMKCMILDSQLQCMPDVLNDGINEKYPFALPSKLHLEIWQNLCRESTIAFDLIYAPRAWQLLERVWDQYEDKYHIMYYHCGGQEGNDSQLGRYKYEGILGKG